MLKFRDHIKLKKMQEEFTRLFPFLKIEFLTESSKHGRNKDYQVKKADKIMNGNKNVHDDEVSVFAPKMTVRELVQLFLEKYGLILRVFRKAGRSWLETSSTSEWTLEKQNAEGEALCA